MGWFTHGSGAPGRGVERCEPRVDEVVDAAERAGHVDLGAVGGCHDLVHGVVGRGRPRGDRAGGGVERRQVGAHRVGRAGLRELAAGVEHAARERDVHHLGVGGALEGGVGRAAGCVHLGEALVVVAADRGEEAAHVDVGAAHDQRLHGVVGVGVPGQERTRLDVERRDVVSRHLAGARGASGRPHRRELPGDVRRVAGDDDLLDTPVGLVRPRRLRPDRRLRCRYRQRRNPHCGQHAARSHNTSTHQFGAPESRRHHLPQPCNGTRIIRSGQPVIG